MIEVVDAAVAVADMTAEAVAAVTAGVVVEAVAVVIEEAVEAEEEVMEVILYNFSTIVYLANRIRWGFFLYQFNSGN